MSAGETSASTTARDDEGPLDERKPWILVVEDDVLNQRVARFLVEKRGFRVQVVADGRAAVEAVAGGSFAAVLMDCQMPHFDGYAATSLIRALDGEGARTPVIAMTAFAERGARERCLAAGMDDYVSKPICAEELDRVLRRFCPIGGAGQPASERRTVDPVLDPKALERLDGVPGVGPSDLVSEVIELFGRVAPEHLTGLRAASAAGQTAEMSRIAHTLRGAAAYVGAAGVVRLCGEIEARPLGPGLLEPLADAIERACAALAAQRSMRGGRERPRAPAPDDDAEPAPEREPEPAG